MRAGIGGEHAVLERGQALEVAVGEGEVAHVELVERVAVAHRVEHQAVAHHPHEGGDGELGVDLGEVGPDLVEIAQDGAEIERQVGRVMSGAFSSRPGRPVELVGGLRPFRTAARLVQADRSRPARAAPAPTSAPPPSQSRRAAGRRALVRCRAARHVARDGVELELVAALVVDDEVGPGRRHFLADDGGDAGRADAFARRVQHLEAHVEGARLGPRSRKWPTNSGNECGMWWLLTTVEEPTKTMRTVRGLRAKDTGPPRQPNALVTSVSGAVALGQEAEGRQRLAVGRIEDEQCAGRVAQA